MKRIEIFFKNKLDVSIIALTNRRIFTQNTFVSVLEMLRNNRTHCALYINYHGIRNYRIIAIFCEQSRFEIYSNGYHKWAQLTTGGVSLKWIPFRLKIFIATGARPSHETRVVD